MEENAESAVFRKFCRRSKVLEKNKIVFNLDFFTLKNNVVAIFFETCRCAKTI